MSRDINSIGFALTVRYLKIVTIKTIVYGRSKSVFGYRPMVEGGLVLMKWPLQGTTNYRRHRSIVMQWPK